MKIKKKTVKKVEDKSEVDLETPKLRSGYPSPRWSGEILDCALPVTFDQFNKCSYGCLYCFSAFQKELKKFNPNIHSDTKNYQQDYLKSVSISSMKNIINLKNENNQFHNFFKEKKVLQWGGLADPFDMFEKKHGVGLELLKEFHKKKYPICFSTKGTWWLKDERYLELFRTAPFWNVKFSIITYNKEKAKIIERGVPSPEERVEAMKKYNEINPKGGATLRLRPFIIGLSNLDYVELIEKSAKAGVTALSTEFFCLETRNTGDLAKKYQKMSEVIGFDIVDFYKMNSSGSGYLRLNHKVKRPYIEKMEKLCKKLGIRFYVSDAHHKDKCEGGCCCGLDNSWNYSKGQLTEMLVLAKNREDHLVYWKDMEPHLQNFKTFLWRRAENFNTSGNRARTKRWDWSMYDYIKDNWNTPNNAKSPYKYFKGLLRPIKLDNSGNVVYKYIPYE